MKWSLWFALLVLSASAAAQTCTQTVPISVLDPKTGSFIPSLQAALLHAKAEKNVLPIVGFQPIKTSRLVILIDESGSMGYVNDPVAHKKEAIARTEEALLQFLKESPEVAAEYGFFNDKVVFSGKLTSRQQELLEGIEVAKSQFGKTGFGPTSLYDALHQALLRLQPVQPGDSIVLLTDGGDNKSKLQAKDIKEELRASGVRLFSFVIAGHMFPPDADEISELYGLVESSGGGVAAIDIYNLSWADKKTLAANINVLKHFWTQQILNGYLLSLEVPANSNKNRKWTLKLDRAADGDLKNAGLRYPNRLPGCPIPTASNR